MVTKKKLEEKIEKWEGVNKYIVRKAQFDLREGNYEDAVPQAGPVQAEAKWDKASLKKLSKAEQVEMLEQLGAEDIPRYEKDRVKLILKLC